MGEVFQGPFCKELNLSTEQLRDQSFTPVGTLSNGLVLEVRDFAFSFGCDFNSLISKLDSRFENVNTNSIKSKVIRLLDQKKKLSHKKKVTGVKNVNDLLNRLFEPPICKPANKSSPLSCVDHELQQSEREGKHAEVFPVLSTTCQISVSVQTDLQSKENLKKLNTLEHQHSKLIKHNEVLSKKVSLQKEVLNQLERKNGHFSVRNVNKRDENARKKSHLLRDSQRHVRKQEKALKASFLALTENRLTIEELQNENAELKETLESLYDTVTLEKQKKVSSQKSISYLKKEVQKCKVLQLTESDNHEECEDHIRKLKLTIEQQHLEIDRLLEQLQDIQNEAENDIVKTKNEDGSYTEGIRLCVIEMSGLEVATAKASPIIQSVARHLFARDIPKIDLPNPSTCQRMIDEGHYIAKIFIAEKIDAVDNWGIGRDGTSRMKKKIVDTSVILDSGDVMCTGFKSVARETAETINNVTKSHLYELGALKDGKENAHQYVARALSKLSFTMSDRASNEKLADKMLDEWRDSILQDTDLEHHEVNHFHCMAHVLLGFHNYITPDIKALETDLVGNNGPIGRDNISYFSSWKNKETCVNRTVRVASDSFGPAGDHLGVRDRWEAYCSDKGVKSLIGNYRDNRFNALFQTSAEVYLHLTDFLSVLDTVTKPNMKLKALQSDLSSNEVKALLQCLGLYYVKFTGPYWNLMLCGKVPYMKISAEILEMKEFLEQCVVSPKHLLQEDGHWKDTDPLEISEVPHIIRLKNALFTINEETQELLFRSISIVADSMLRTIKKQLVDFLPDGKFFQAADEAALNRTQFAPVTNLGCEHHFGDLDSSQKRRPSASFHHHSSVQLLKRNRCQMMKWISSMKPEDKCSLLASARKAGPELRREHLKEEKNVLREIHDSVTLEFEKSKKRKAGIRCGANKRHRPEAAEEKEVDLELPHDNDFNVNEYVAVAYQDSWYPGVVEKVVEEQIAIVKFMVPCRQEGQFQWPRREDKQTVNLNFVIRRNFVPDCVNSGRQWFVAQHEEINEVYMKFHKLYFL